MVSLEELLAVTVDPSECNQAEFETMELINNSGLAWIDNDLDTETYLDILDFAGIDPYAHIDKVQEFFKNFL